MKKTLWMLAVVLSLVALVGCVSQTKYNADLAQAQTDAETAAADLVKANQALTKTKAQLKAAQDEVAALKTQVTQLQTGAESIKATIEKAAKLSDATIKKLEVQLDAEKKATLAASARSKAMQEDLNKMAKEILEGKETIMNLRRRLDAATKPPLAPKKAPEAPAEGE